MAQLSPDSTDLKINPEDDRKLEQFWKDDDLWPVVQDYAVKILDNPDRDLPTCINFCPEAIGKRFGWYAKIIAPHATKLDKEVTEGELREQGVPGDHWRWLWRTVEPQHYTECRFYEALRGRESGPKQSESKQPDHSAARSPSSDSTQQVEQQPEGPKADTEAQARVAQAEPSSAQAAMAQSQAAQGRGAALSTADQRCQWVDAVIKQARDKGVKLTRTMIWKKAGYDNATQFERWQGNRKGQTDRANAAFKRVLDEKPWLNP